MTGWDKLQLELGVRRGDSGALVEHIQHKLITQGYGLGRAGADGKFGPLTEAAIALFQKDRGLEPNGVVNEATFDALGVSDPETDSGGFKPATRPAGAQGQPLPPAPFPPLVGNASRAQVFGRFDYVPAPTPGNPEGIRILGDWEAKNLVTIEIPQLARIPGIEYQGQIVGRGPKNGHVVVHRLVATQMQRLWQAWDDASLLGHVLTWGGLRNARFIRGSSSTLSNHAWGTAFDINVPWNALGAKPARAGSRGSVIELVPAAYEHGFYWGGLFSRCDPMHFEVAKVQQ